MAISHKIKTSVTAEQKRLLDAKIKKLGMTQSEYIRRSLFSRDLTKDDWAAYVSKVKIATGLPAVKAEQVAVLSLQTLKDICAEAEVK